MINLSAVHKGFSGVNVLNGITFNVNQGELVSVIGKIGAGKSTIMNIVCGLIRPDKGDVYIDGGKVDSNDRRYLENVGFLLSGEYLIEDFSPVLYWECVGKLRNCKREFLKKRIRALLDICQISDPKKPICKLSSGNRMLVKIGAMLLTSPAILIIDEPFSDLDIHEVSKIERLLRDCHTDGKTICMTSHFLEPVFRLSDLVLLLEDGLIKESYAINSFSSYESFYSTVKDRFSIID